MDWWSPLRTGDSNSLEVQRTPQDEHPYFLSFTKFSASRNLSHKWCTSWWLVEIATVDWISGFIKYHWLASSRNRSQHASIHMCMHSLTPLVPLPCSSPFTPPSDGAPLPFTASPWAPISDHVEIPTTSAYCSFEGEDLKLCSVLPLSTGSCTYTEQADTYSRHSNKGAQPPGRKTGIVTHYLQRVSYYLPPWPVLNTLI